MKRILLASLVSLIGASNAPAQIPLEIDFDRIERPWHVPEVGEVIPNGATFAGADTDLICGAFIPNHDGRSAVVVRGGTAYLSFQPASFDHMVPVTMPGTLAPGGAKLGTLAAIDGGADRIAALTNLGLEIWRYDDQSGFVPVAAQGPDAAFVGARRIIAGLHSIPGGPENHVLAIGPGWVRGGIIMNNDQLLTGPQISFPPMVNVLDAAPVFWTGADLPEIGVLTTAGLFVLDIAGNVIDSLAGTASDGLICTLRQAGVPALCAVVDSGSDWVLHTWPSNGSSALTSGTFGMPTGPTGITSVDLDSDNYPEIVVSAKDSVRRAFFGSATGPTLLSRLHVHDVDSNATSSLPLSNDVPMVVDDIDRDGNPDFVIQSSATNQLIVMLDALPQTVQQVSLPPTSIPDYDGLGAPEMLGQMAGVGTWAAPGTQRDLFGMRFDIPSWVPNGMALQIFVYPQANGKFSPEAIACFHYSLPGGAADHKFDVLVPVGRHSVLSVGESHSYVFEARLIDMLGNSPVEATKPSLCQYDVYESMIGDAAFESQLNPTHQGGWAIGLMGLSLQEWNNNSFSPYADPFDPDTGSPPSRYIGIVIPVDSIPADIELPKSIPPTSLSNGKLRL